MTSSLGEVEGDAFGCRAGGRAAETAAGIVGPALTALSGGAAAVPTFAAVIGFAEAFAIAPVRGLECFEEATFFGDWVVAAAASGALVAGAAVVDFGAEAAVPGGADAVAGLAGDGDLAGCAATFTVDGRGACVRGCGEGWVVGDADRLVLEGAAEVARFGVPETAICATVAGFVVADFAAAEDARVGFGADGAGLAVMAVFVGSAGAILVEETTDWAAAGRVVALATGVSAFALAAVTGAAGRRSGAAGFTG